MQNITCFSRPAGLSYLRKNFTAVASAEPIPFTSELEHTRAYLAVEQAQHSKSLFVEYDTPGDGGGTVVTVTIPSSASPKMNP